MAVLDVRDKREKAGSRWQEGIGKGRRKKRVEIDWQLASQAVVAGSGGQWQQAAAGTGGDRSAGGGALFFCQALPFPCPPFPFPAFT